MRLRILAAAAAAALAAGCGAVEEEAAQPTSSDAAPALDELRPAPPLEAYAGPVPDDALALLDLRPPDAEGWTSYGGSLCTRAEFGPPPGSSPEDGEPCPDEEIAAILAEERAVQPAAEPDPRAVARVRLAGGGFTYYLEYLSEGAGRCPFFHAEDGTGFPAGGATGGPPCTAGGIEGFCDRLCLTSLPLSVERADEHAVLAGLVPADGDELRITFADGYAARYPLAGPLHPDDPSRRIFMVEETHGLPTRLELLRSGEIVATEEPPPMLGPGDELPPDLLEEISGTPDVELELDGQTLRVEIGPDAPPEAQALLTDEEIVFVCVGLDDPEEFPDDPDGLPPAHTFGRFPAGERAVTVELEAPVAGRPVGCVVHHDAEGDDDEEPDVFRTLIPPDELMELEDG